jgi:Holliday junction resolvasome RuvABC ATP-dependent DNA helicase subunit
MLLPSKFIPQTAADFVGPAGNVARRMMRFIHHSKQTGDALAFLLTGHPGIGKTALARFAGHQLGVEGALLEPMNGTQLTVERVEEIATRLHYRPMFGDWHFIFVDEFEFVTNAAKARLLTVLNVLPRWSAFVATCNRGTDDLAQRNHSRFNAFELTCPEPQEIRDFLFQKFGIPAELADAAIKCATRQVDLFTTIDMRQVLKDCDEVILMRQAA